MKKDGQKCTAVRWRLANIYKFDKNLEFKNVDGIVTLNMPGKVKVRVLSGRQLPVMDRASDTTDAFAEVKLGDTTFKTEVCR